MISLIKVVVGAAIGAGIGAAAVKLLAADDESTDDVANGAEAAPGGIGARLKLAGEQSRAVRALREEELRNAFRRRVGDPTAMTQPAEPTVS